MSPINHSLRFVRCVETTREAGIKMERVFDFPIVETQKELVLVGLQG
jgi:hypothetical protein